jgi:group I intron endonuclease
MTSGIYALKGPGRVYVGQSQNIEARRSRHLSDLRRGVHTNAHMQAAWSLYGAQAFSFEVIETCDIARLNERELFWITELKAVEKGYNKRVDPVSNRGIKYSAEIRAKVGAAIRQALASPAAREKLRQIRKRTFSDPNLRAKISAKGKAYYADPEARARQREITNRTHADPALRERLSNKAKAAWANPEIRAKQAAAIRAGQNNAGVLVKKSVDAKEQMRSISKLSDEIVQSIRSRYVRGCSIDGGAAIAREYGISPCTVSAILKRRIWRD